MGRRPIERVARGSSETGCATICCRRCARAPDDRRGAARPSADQAAQLARRTSTRSSTQRLDVRSAHAARLGLDVQLTRSLDFGAELAVLWPAIAARVGVTLDRRGIARLAAFTVCGAGGLAHSAVRRLEVVRSRDALQLRASTEAWPTPSAMALSAHERRWWSWSFRPARPARSRDDAVVRWLPSDRAAHRSRVAARRRDGGRRRAGFAR